MPAKAKLAMWALPALALIGAMGVVMLARDAGEPRTIPYTDVNPYGANFFLEREVEGWKQDRTLEMAQATGIGWIKQQFPWA